MKELLDCTGFQWDDGNADKNWSKHRVSKTECEQVFFNQPLLVTDDLEHSELEPDQHLVEARICWSVALGDRLDLLLAGGVGHAFDRGRSFGSGETSPLLSVGLEFR